MEKGCLAIPQEVGGHTQNGGVRVTVCIPCTHARPYGDVPITSNSSARSVALRICRVRSFRYDQVGVESEWVNMRRGIREAYRDLAHIIHERFCYNREPSGERQGARGKR